MRSWFSDAPPLALVLLALSAGSCIAAATALYVPGVRTRFVEATSAYSAGRFVAGFRDSHVPEFATFAASLAAAVASTAVDASHFARPNAVTARRIAEAGAAALWAVAAHSTLGGVAIVSALVAASLTFVSALSDSFILLALALATTLVDGARTSGPQVAARAVFALSYALYAVATEVSRSRPGMNAIIAWASRMTTLWQAYAVTSAMAANDVWPNDALYAATLLPAAVVGAYYMVVSTDSLLIFPQSPPPLPPPPQAMQARQAARVGKRRHETETAAAFMAV